MNLAISVLANSLPRGGPFLLSSALRILGYRKYSGADVHGTPAAFNYLEAQKALQGRQTAPGDNMIGISPFAPCYVEQAMMRDWLSVLAGDEYIMAHIPWSSVLSSAMAGLACRHVTIIRDPRALLLSLLFDTHPMPRFLIESFVVLSPEEQLNFMLSGGDVPQAGLTLKSFAQMYRSMLAWLNAPDCLVVRFEDLAGSQGGGSREQQRDTVRQMAAFLGLPVDELVDSKLSEIHDPSVATFRLDQMDDWENEVGRNIVEQVLAACGTLVCEAGYIE